MKPMNIQDTIHQARRQHGAHNPFGSIHMTKAPSKPTAVDALKICNDPLPATRVHSGKKYDPVFVDMKLGQAVNCACDEVGRVSGAMRKFIQIKKIKAMVRTVKDYGDGRGRVWMLAEDAGNKA